MSVVTESCGLPEGTRTDDRRRGDEAAARGAPWRTLLRRLLARRLLLGTLLLGGTVAGAVGLTTTRNGHVVTSDAKLIYHTVQRGNLPIMVTERGNLESQKNIEIICEVDDLPGDGVSGTVVVSIVPNGASVKKGDLLVEFESSHHIERLDLEILDTERARAAQIQAQAKYDNQITQNETAKAEAELKVKLAQLELEMFRDQRNGTYKLGVQASERLIDDANNEILAAQASLELKKNDKRGIESLFKLGYAGKSELDRTRLEFLQAEGTYAAKMNRLKTEQASLDKKQTYEQQMSLLQLEGTLKTAQRKVLQVDRDNEAQLAQAKAALTAANESLKKEEERLARFRDQVDKCKIYAPDEGMVAYAISNSYLREEIREGAVIRPRQPILYLPNLKKMQVKTSVHESVLDEIQSDLPATVRVDAFPDRTYSGTIKSVAVMPEQSGWLSSDTKVYETIVTIPDEVDQLKPGMTAVVEIHVVELKEVLTVPVQAIVQVQKETWCYVDVNGSLTRRPITPGRNNDKFVEIKDGLAVGERVVLNPMAIADESNRPDQPDPKSPVAEPATDKPSTTDKPSDKSPSSGRPRTA